MEIGRQARVQDGGRGKGREGGELCMMEMGRQAGRQEDGDDGDLQGRKVIKSFFLFLFLLFSLRRSFVRSFAASSKFPISTKMRERR